MIQSSDKDKIAKLDRDLKVAIIGCLAVGVLLSGFIAYEFFNFHLREDPIELPVEKHQALVEAVQYFLFSVIPVLAGGYLLVGFVIWNYLRKKRRLESAE